MKVSTKEIMLLGNPQHPDFGTFARFITGMGEYVRFNDTTYVCNVCFRPVFVLNDNDPHNPKNQVCNYCRGKKDGLAENAIVVEKVVERVIEVEHKPKTLAEFYIDHEHSFGNARNNPCKICGVFKGVALIVNEPQQ